MNILVGITLELILVVFLAMLGMALLPSGPVRDLRNRDEIAAFLFSSILGFAVWLGLTCAIGMILPYNRIFLFIMLGISAAFIILRRNCLFVPRNKGLLFFVIAAFIASAVVLYAVLPLETRDGIYFSASAADNTRVCLVNAIANKGLPPVNPFLTYNGDLIRAYYHFGLVAFAAQPVIMFGINGIVANALTNSMAMLFAVFACGAISYKFSNRISSWIFIIIFFLTGAPQNLLESILPLNVQNILYPHESFIGFFSFLGEFDFSPHACMASVIMVLVMYLYAECLQQDNIKNKLWMAALIGVSAAGAFFNSIYGGVLAAAILALTVLILYALKKNFRLLVNRSLLAHLVIVVIAVLLSAAYMLYILSRPGNSVGGIALGILPAYGKLSVLGVFGAILDFYLFVLPSNVGVFILFALAIIFAPKLLDDKLLPNGELVSILRTFVGVVMFSLFVVHSNALTNDYGWRMIEIPYLVGIIFASCLVSRLFEYMCEKGKVQGTLVILACVVVFFANIQSIKAQVTHEVHPDNANTIFKESIKGWEVVREYTDKDDIVMSNPMAFNEISLRDESNDYQGVNYFSAYYAGRFIAINDLLTPKTSFVGPQSFDEIDELYYRMVDIFEGNPDSEDVIFLADEQKVKALLVLAQDGLWNNEGDLCDRYTLVDETEYYKVYISE